MSVSVCLLAYLKNHISKLHEIPKTCDRGSIFLWRRSNTLWRKVHKSEMRNAKRIEDWYALITNSNLCSLVVFWTFYASVLHTQATAVCTKLRITTNVRFLAAKTARHKFQIISRTLFRLPTSFILADLPFRKLIAVRKSSVIDFLHIKQ